MFIAQVMYAEGLIKILNAILRVRKYEQDTHRIRREIDILKSAAAILAELPHSNAKIAIQIQLAKTGAMLNNKMEQYSTDLALLEKCGIKYEEYEEKFRLISSDCLRISHDSVKPPKWEMA